MLDSTVRVIIDVPLNYIGKRMAALGFSANYITFLGFFLGIIAIHQIIIGNFQQALIFLIINRFCDGIDGAIARHTNLTDFGGFLDIICDFVIYSGIVLAFAINDHSKALAAAFLIFCFIGPITSFLAYAIIAAKRKVNTDASGKKSFYHLGGICEGTETALILILMCIVPNIYIEICLIYGLLCIITTVGRCYAAYVDFHCN